MPATLTLCHGGREQELGIDPSERQTCDDRGKKKEWISDMAPVKAILGFLVSALAPIITVAIGAGVAGVGLSINSPIVTGIGLVLIAVGFLWGLLSYGGFDLS